MCLRKRCLSLTREIQHSKVVLEVKKFETKEYRAMKKKMVGNQRFSKKIMIAILASHWFSVEWHMEWTVWYMQPGN